MHPILEHAIRQTRRQFLTGVSGTLGLAALSSPFEYLCERTAISHNPVKRVKRLKVESGGGKTSALGDHQARAATAAA